MSANVVIAARPPKFGSVQYAKVKSPQAWEFAINDAALKAKHRWIDPPANLDLPKSEKEWETLTPKEIREKAGPFVARAMFKREIVIHCGIQSAFYFVFSCKNPDCDRKGKFFAIKCNSGYSNLINHASRCYGTSYQPTLDHAQTQMTARSQGASAVLERTFLPPVRSLSSNIQSSLILRLTRPLVYRSMSGRKVFATLSDTLLL
jgi:hypothetical protein